MLVQGQVFEFKWNRQNIDYFTSKGYQFTNFGDIIQIAAEDLSNGSSKKVLVRCDYCGLQKYVVYRDYTHYDGEKYACQHCRQRHTSQKTLVKRRQDLYKRALQVCQTKGYQLLCEPQDIFTSDTRIKYRCPLHGVHQVKIYSLIWGRGCMQCGHQLVADFHRKTPEQVVAEATRHGITVLNPQQYIGWSQTNLKVVCPQCGEVFLTSYCVLTRTEHQTCKKCSKSESMGERKVEDFLSSNNIDFIAQYRPSACRDHLPLSFDFFLPEYNIAIQYQGRQHFESVEYYGGQDRFEIQQKHDKIKKDYCLEHKIELLEILYNEYDKVTQILTDKLKLHKDMV